MNFLCDCVINVFKLKMTVIEFQISRTCFRNSWNGDMQKCKVMETLNSCGRATNLFCDNISEQFSF